MEAEFAGVAGELGMLLDRFEIPESAREELLSSAAWGALRGYGAFGLGFGRYLVLLVEAQCWLAWRERRNQGVAALDAVLLELRGDRQCGAWLERLLPGVGEPCASDLAVRYGLSERRTREASPSGVRQCVRRLTRWLSRRTGVQWGPRLGRGGRGR